MQKIEKKTNVWMLIWGLQDGGAETLAREYARFVDKEAFDASIVTVYPFRDTANYHRTQELGLRTISIYKKRNAITRVLRVVFGKWYIPYRLLKMIRKEKPDCIHFNSSMAHRYLPIADQVQNVRLVYTCHSEVSKHFSYTEEQAVKALIRKCGIKLIALHEDMRKEMNDHFDVEDIVIIKNGVDFARFQHPQKKRVEVREELKIAEDAVVIGHIGRFAEAKNHAFLLKVFRCVLNKEPKAHLLLVGNGALEAQIRQAIVENQMEEHVTVLSHRTDIPELLNAIDVIVFPSIWEGLSVTLVEAQAAGVRCIVSDTVNEANFLTETTIPVSLSVAPEEWAERVLNKELRHTPHGCLSDYDMKREIRKLEQLYLGYSEI